MHNYSTFRSPIKKSYLPHQYPFKFFVLTRSQIFQLDITNYCDRNFTLELISLFYNFFSLSKIWKLRSK